MTYPEIIRAGQKMGMIIDEAVGVTFEMLINAEAEIGSIIRLPSLRKLYLEKYQVEINRRTLVPIEDQAFEIKQHYWKEARGHSTDRETRTQAAKILYLVDQLCQRRLDTQD